MLSAQNLVIAIDGPAGAGKSTVAKLLAKKFGLKFLDTGAMYRCAALLAQRNGLGPEDGERAAALAEAASIDFGVGDPPSVLLNGEDVSQAIRTLEIGELASALSAYSAVRRVIAGRQRAIVAEGGYTLEGRDTTTVIAPQAPVRVYLDASIEVRAKRRYDELIAKGQSANLEEIKQGIAERDHRDSTRADSPLMKAPGVTVIDTSHLSIEEAVEAVSRLAEAALTAG